MSTLSVLTYSNGSNVFPHSNISPYLSYKIYDEVILLNNSKLGDFVDRIYAINLEIKDTSYTAISA